MTCEVQGNCLNYGHCPYCVWGSQYRPKSRQIRYPLEVDMAQARAAATKAHRATAAYQTGRRSNRKGKRLERELAALVHGERVPLSGELENYPNDVIAKNGWRLECKGRGSGLSLLYRWLEGQDVLALNDGAGWLYAVRLAEYAQALWGAVPKAASLDAWVEPVLEGQVRVGSRAVRVRRPRRGLDTVRAWLLAEGADALCFKADRMGWLLIADGDHMAAVLAAMGRAVDRASS